MYKRQVLGEWDNGIQKTLLVLPTGCGKTVVFAKITEEQVRKGNRVLILAHRGELLEQAADKLKTVTGLRCATEKAENSCLGSWYRVDVYKRQLKVSLIWVERRRDELKYAARTNKTGMVT